jgi:thiamine biosynthesis lipoprotein
MIIYQRCLKPLKNYIPYLTVLLLSSTVFLGACEQPAKQYNYSILAFGTLIDITLYDINEKQARDAFTQLQQNFDQYHQHWSPWTNGDLAQINKQLINKNTLIPVPAHLVPLIKTSIELSKQSDYYFNPAIGQLINLWQFHKYQDENIRPPDDHQIQNLIKKNPQLSDLTLNDQNQLINKNPAVSLNFGAFAKGYGIELGINQLQKLNIQNAVINAGGDLSVIGQHGERAWNIGIRHPRKDSILASIEAKNNESIFTSGDYERFYNYQGKRYHHILDPATGYPTQDAQSVTVIHTNAGRADAAATALFVAGSKNWQHIAKNMGIRYVMLIDSNGNIHMTPLMEKRIKFLNKSPTSRIILSEEL